MSGLFFTDDPGTIATENPGSIFNGASGIFTDLLGTASDLFKSREQSKLARKLIDSGNASLLFGGANPTQTQSAFGDDFADGGLSKFQMLSLGVAVAGVLIAYLALRK